MPRHQVAEIWHFFAFYEALAPDKSAGIRGWEGRRKAIEALEHAGAVADQLTTATGTQG